MDIVQRSLVVVLVIGTLLVLINQGDRILAGSITSTVVLKIILTYCVPYLVSTYAGIEAIKGSKNAHIGVRVEQILN